MKRAERVGYEAALADVAKFLTMTAEKAKETKDSSAGEVTYLIITGVAKLIEPALLDEAAARWPDFDPAPEPVKRPNLGY